MFRPAILILVLQLNNQGRRGRKGKRAEKAEKAEEAEEVTSLNQQLISQPKNLGVIKCNYLLSTFHFDKLNRDPKLFEEHFLLPLNPLKGTLLTFIKNSFRIRKKLVSQNCSSKTKAEKAEKAEKETMH